MFFELIAGRIEKVGCMWDRWKELLTKVCKFGAAEHDVVHRFIWFVAQLTRIGGCSGLSLLRCALSGMCCVHNRNIMHYSFREMCFIGSLGFVVLICS